ncbi:hypothetical protein LOTGIDRAFT_162607 [Lottia gigantea]|uniref:Uncharacterized protein n=1 Tax=Lottia gigantea TaxID=225164 RepID=V4BT68_LOTGI|nr:hypothetical protein LOTGIDRAFT_162607 [Lottia gigantea]ESO92304.1 hypothetical protein LOTGIDRAFT_162607 [Lottia gigantea]
MENRKSTRKRCTPKRFLNDAVDISKIGSSSEGSETETDQDPLPCAQPQLPVYPLDIIDDITPVPESQASTSWLNKTKKKDSAATDTISRHIRPYTIQTSNVIGKNNKRIRTSFPSQSTQEDFTPEELSPHLTRIIEPLINS